MPERADPPPPLRAALSHPWEKTAPNHAALDRRLRQPRLWHWLVWAALLVLLDQRTKQYFDTHLYYGERWPVLPFFDFTLLYNTGAAFSFLAQGQGWQRWLLTGIAAVATVWIVWLLRRHPQQTLFCAALASILGGAVGNLIDRLQYGHVVDFLLFYRGSWFFPAFNVADVAISCGAGLLILDELLRLRRARAAKTKEAP